MNRPEHATELVLTTALQHAVARGNEIIRLRGSLREISEGVGQNGCDGFDDTICSEGEYAFAGPVSTPESILAVLETLERVEKQAIKFDRRPLALIATCVLCGESTESFSLHRMDPSPRHAKGCVLDGFANDAGAKYEQA
jgi:hypothetical protein